MGTKKDPFDFVSERVCFVDIRPSKQLYIIYRNYVTAKRDSALNFVSLWSRRKQHMSNVSFISCRAEWEEIVVFSTGDSDLVVIVIYVFNGLVQNYVDLQLWILFGHGKNSSVYDIRKIYKFLGLTKIHALPVFCNFHWMQYCMSIYWERETPRSECLVIISLGYRSIPDSCLLECNHWIWEVSNDWEIYLHLMHQWMKWKKHCSRKLSSPIELPTNWVTTNTRNFFSAFSSVGISGKYQCVANAPIPTLYDGKELATGLNPCRLHYLLYQRNAMYYWNVGATANHFVWITSCKNVLKHPCTPLCFCKGQCNTV